jgi:hypothetical protein
MLAISELMMPDTQRPDGSSNAGQASVIAPGDVAPAPDRGFGFALLLLSALFMLTGVAITVMVDWRGGLAMFLVATVMLSLFLRWEMRRSTRQRTVPATQAQADLIITETSPL